jgi:hypothetical protein
MVDVRVVHTALQRDPGARPRIRERRHVTKLRVIASKG